jgi:hypothetical protein
MLSKRKIGRSRGDVIRYLKQPTQVQPRTAINPFNRVSQLSDAEGLRRAYQQPNHIYINNNRMYIAGSKSLEDWKDNLLIPPQLTEHHNIYRSALEELKDNQNVTELVGHSAGGAAVLELDKRYPDRIQKTRTYGAPVISFGNEQLDERHLRFRAPFDPVAMFDNAATTINKHTINPFANHSYEDFGDIGKEID